MSEKRKIAWWQTVLLVGTVLAAFFKIYIGMDNDESYIVTMGVRLLKGDRIFKEMWELHLTSAWPAGICAWIWVRLTGSLDGIVVFMRWVSTIAQFGTAFLVYAVIKKYFRQETAFVAGIFVANFLPRATQNMEYGQLEMIFMLWSLCLLFDAMMQRRDAGKICLAAVCYAVAVLAYPTILVSAPFLAGALLYGFPEKKVYHSFLFWGTCAVCAVIFLGYLFSYLTVPEFLENLKGILSDGTHSDTMKMLSYGKQIVSVSGRIVMILVGAVALYFLYRITERIGEQKQGSASGKTEKSGKPDVQERTFEKRECRIAAVEMLSYACMASMALIVMGLNLTGLRPSGAIGFQARYLLVTVLAPVMMWQICRNQRMTGESDYREKRKTANFVKIFFILFYLTGIGIYLGVMVGSNMGIEENASFLYLCMLAALVLFVENLEKISGKPARKFVSLCIGIFLVGVIFTKGYFVRITGTGPANITEERVTLKEGPLKGLHVDAAYAEEYAEKRAEVSGETDGGDNALILCDNAIYNLSSNGTFTSATCISTPVYNEEWVQYYEKEENELPTVLFLDRRKFDSWDSFRDCEFGTWLIEKYGLEKNSWEGEKEFYILRLK